MTFPGRRLLRHWWWKIAFKYPRLRIALTHLLIPSRDTDIELFGARLRINTREEIGLWRAANMAEGNIVFRDEVASLVNIALLLRPGDTFVDVGANVGLYSSTLARLAAVFPNTNFIAIEPHPETAQRLQASAGNRVTVLNIGASDAPGELGFASGVTSGVFKITAADSAQMRIRCERLDALDLPAGDLVLKIDVEGHELPALRGATALFDAERVKIVYVDGYSDETLPAFLQERGFSLFHGRTLQRCQTEALRDSLLAIHLSRLAVDAGEM